MTPKDQFRYSVLSAIHDEALSISDAIDQAYREHVAGKDAEIERLRADHCGECGVGLQMFTDDPTSSKVFKPLGWKTDSLDNTVVDAV